MPLQTGETRMVEEHLRSRLPAARVDVYRQNSASIRVRIIDGNFTGQSRIDREEKVLPYLRELSEDTRSDITVLLLLGPEEQDRPPMNVEFEHPVPSSL